MYIEFKGDQLTGPARIGRVEFSKMGMTLYYGGKSFRSLKGGYKANYADVETRDEYWISGCKRDGSDRLYGERDPGRHRRGRSRGVLDGDPRPARAEGPRRRQRLAGHARRRAEAAEHVGHVALEVLQDREQRAVGDRGAVQRVPQSRCPCRRRGSGSPSRRAWKSVVFDADVISR